MSGVHRRSYGYIPRKRRTVEPPDRESDHVYKPLHDDESSDMCRLSLDRRLRLADLFAQTHPGRPVSAMLMDLFPELKQIPWRRSVGND